MSTYAVLWFAIMGVITVNVVAGMILPRHIGDALNWWLGPVEIGGMFALAAVRFGDAHPISGGVYTAYGVIWAWWWWNDPSNRRRRKRLRDRIKRRIAQMATGRIRVVET